MRTMVAGSAVALLICHGILCAERSSGSMDRDAVPRLVSYSDIPNKVKLIGRLGISLGEKAVTVRGKWKEGRESTKPGDFVFVVTSMNGSEMRCPIEIHWGSVQPFMPRGSIVPVSDNERKWVAQGWRTKERPPKAFDGDEWEMFGFETGHTVGYPREIRQMYRKTQNPCTAGTFVTVFRFATLRTFGKPHGQSETGGYTLGYQDEEADDSEHPPENKCPIQGTGSGMF